MNLEITESPNYRINQHIAELPNSIQSAQVSVISILSGQYLVIGYNRDISVSQPNQWSTKLAIFGLMASIIPDFEYDIFVSYRHKDNKGDHWVTEFISSLKAELEATFKEDISVYFDINPHDGLLETHNVDKSLEGKLRCLIFLPIISRTYCDQKSFAWQHEFCAFNKMAKEDQFGRDIKLAIGNVASRILPIKIHDLDEEDKSLLEKELGGPVRAIEFIYKETGVNRPLKTTDNKNDNQNKTDYGNQVNKVANAIREIVTSLKRPAPQTSGRITNQQPPSKRSNRKAVIAMVSSLLLMITAGYFLYPRLLPNSNEGVALDHSVAVLPFVNMSNDPDQEYFSDGITEQIITNLSHIHSLKVIARTSVMKFKKTSKTIAEIGKELNVTHVLEGSIRKSEDRIRVTAQLISVKDETHIWAQDYDRGLTDIFNVQDQVSEAIANSLQRKLTPQEYENFKSARSTSVEAYEHLLKGFYIHNELYYIKRLKEDFVNSEIEFKKAIHLDTGYAVAYAGLADLYDTYRNFSARSPEERRQFEAKRDYYSNIAIKLSPDNPYVLSVRAYSFSNKPNRTEADLDSTFKYGRKAVSIAPNNASICDVLSGDYARIGLYDQAIALRERTITLDPTFGNYFALLGQLYIRQGEFHKAQVALQKAMLIQPDGIEQLGNWAFLCLLDKNLSEAERTIDRIKQINQENNTDILEAFLLALKGKKENALAKRKIDIVYLSLGMKKEALDVMEKDTQLNYLFLKNFPAFHDLRSDPRFHQLLEKAKVVYEDRLRKYAN